MIRPVFFVFISGLMLTSSSRPYQVSLGSSVWGYFTPPVLKKYHRPQSPMEAMVDLTNSLGVAILKDHSYSRGNFAFSPYGVASVLVVMYEGARGESANQIRRAVGFPSNRDVLRTGFRDIHRRLRSYFSHEGFLSGISLNKNGSNLKPEYKKILKFYGYDVELNQSFDEDDQNAKPSTQTETTTVAVTTTFQTNTDMPSPTTHAMKEEADVQNTTPEAKNPEVMNKEDESTTEGTTVTTAVKETITTTEKLTAEGDQSTNINLQEEEVLSTTSTISSENEITDQPVFTTETSFAMESTSESDSEEMTTRRETGDKSLNSESYERMKQLMDVFPGKVGMKVPEMLTPEDDKENQFQKNLNSDKEEPECAGKEGASGRNVFGKIVCKKTKNSTTGEESAKPEPKAPEGKTESDVIKLDNGMLIPQSGEEPTATKADLGKTASGSGFLQMTAEPIDPNKRPEDEISLGKSSGRKSSRTGNKVATRRGRNSELETQLTKMLDAKSYTWLFEPERKRKRKNRLRLRRTITDYLKWPLNPDLSLQLQNGMYDTHVSRNSEMYRSLPRLMFLVDGAIDTPVPMMTFTNIFPYGYIPRLHAKAMEFPLDDIRYKLLIVLPVERRGLRQLIYDLTDFSVRDVLKCVQPTRVKAVIPTFMVEGFVILTSSLQRLGILDVFDPRKANLSGMSVDPELYVRNVEQSVTVVIRNYVEILDIQTRTMAARHIEHEFHATHPFLYFVLDTATNVALMAGQMLDPLNSRIY